MRTRRFWWEMLCGPVAIGIAGMLLGTGPAAAQTVPAGDDHYLGYQVLRREDRRPQSFDATLTDPFQTLQVEILAPDRHYNPVDKDGGGISQPDTHLVGYRLNRFTRHVPQTVRVVNQFGTQTLRTRRPDRLLVPSTKALGDAPLYSISRDDAILRVVDSANGATLDASITISVPGETVDGGNGLAWHPRTGQLFALLTLDGQDGRELVTLDPATGAATRIGDTGRKFAALAFSPDGTLYGVTGDGDPDDPEALFVIDPIDATSTLVLALGAGDDGEAIAFDPREGLVYHASGFGAPNDPEDGEIFERIDPVTLAVTRIRLSRFDYDEITALLARRGEFLAADLNDDLLRITTRGFVTRLGEMDHQSKGLASVLSPNPNPPPNLISVSPRDDLLRVLDPANGATLDDAVTLTLDGEAPDGVTGLARHPVTGTLFAVLRFENEGRELVTLDPVTGVATPVGDTGRFFAGITFGADGTLYGVTGDGDSDPESLFVIDPADATSILLTALGNGSSGEVIAFDPDDGLLYHGSGQIFETVDPATLAVTDVPLSGFSYSELFALALQSAGSFLAADDGSDFLAITRDGVVTQLGAMDHDAKGLAFRPEPAGGLISVSPRDAVLRVLDPTNGSTLDDSVRITTVDGRGVRGAHGLAQNPLTGTFFAILRIDERRVLVTLDAATGVATRVGETGRRFAGIAFGTDGRLFGVTGDGDREDPESLFTLDPSNASSIRLAALGNGDDGEVIAFNPDDGLLYHASGSGAPNDPVNGEVFETVDPTTLAVTDVPLSGFDYTELLSLLFRSAGHFFAADRVANFLGITDDGVVTELGSMDHDAKGLAFQPHPDAVDHFLCYGVGHERFERRTVTLEDQFVAGPRSLVVQKPLSLCTPVAKQRAGLPVEPVADLDRHLVCYLVTPREKVRVDISTHNQLRPEALGVRNEWELCLPSERLASGAGG